MNRLRSIVAATAFLAAVGGALAYPAPKASAKATAAPAQTAATPADSLNRAVAVFIASNVAMAVDNAMADLMVTGVDVDTARVKALVTEELYRSHSEADRREAIATIEKAVDAVMTAANADIIAQAQAAPGAVTLPSGVVLETILEGTGSTPAAEDNVALRYTGRLPDGTVFDGIAPDETPMRVRASDLVPGMTEGLTHMRRGGEYRLTIPAAMAYGANGVPGVIPPNCVLQFDISLLDE
ncbi:MAG: FKBP-type peptidyl-prolyl cis-trans isomerase [Muribaculaceae bacterium]|nr:FKBP-type peptidyl-prolyl cis-trans isomerase [Muribaculaceae bacterium]